MATSKSLTEDMIDELPDDDPGEALDLLEDFGIDADGVETTADAQKRLREFLNQNKQKDTRFKCKECSLTSEDLVYELDLEKARLLLEEHHIITQGGEVTTVETANSLLTEHLNMKLELEEENLLPIYSTDKVAKVVEQLVEENRYGRLKLLTHCHKIQTYVESIPEARVEDIHRQLPTLQADLKAAESELMKDDCTIMVAGETGSGKSCLLNLLLGALSTELMSVNNLPSTSALTEIKYGEKPRLKAHHAEGDAPPECLSLDREDAPAVIQRFTHQEGDRTQFKYKKVEVFWPCDWIKNGITITDTPGVGENEELTTMVKDYIPKAYGFIYVINTPNAGGINPEELEDLLFYHITREGLEGASEMTTGEHAARVKFDPRSAIFVCNKWDQVAANERAEIKDHVKMKLKKVWRDFDFDRQVFFLSATKTIEEVKSNYVSKEFRRLLLGIQNLLLVGFKTKLEKQFWSLFHVMDRCTWVLKSFIMCQDEEGLKQKKRDQYREARARLDQIKKRPDKARQEMRDILNEEVSFALSQIRSHMRSTEAVERLLRWQENECPDNDNLERLHNLQNALAQRRIKKEINKFEQDQGIFEGIQKKLLDRFHKIFVSVESELASIEQTMKDEAKLGLAYSPVASDESHVKGSTKFTTGEKIAMGLTSPIWVPLGIVAGAFALPFAGIKALKKQRAARRQLNVYRKNKPQAMEEVTKGVLSEFLEGDKLRNILEEKLGMLRQKFNRLLDRIPNIIQANQKLVSELERELDKEHDFQEYIPIYNTGLKLQDAINCTYLIHIRTYNIEMAQVRDMKKIGEGSFAVVYKGKLTARDGHEQTVAVKRQKEPLSEETATDFMVEELNLLRIQSPNIVKYLGASYKRNKEVMYPVMIQEYCAQSLSDIIYNKKKYQGPGAVAGNDPKRPDLLSRAAQYCNEMSKGLMAMHNMGLVHRDLKPENILVDTQDRVKLCDLGISKREADIMMTMAGTPMYMAPEVLQEKQYNRTVDIFSLGLIAWEVWYGIPIEKSYTIDNYETFRRRPFRPHEPPKDWGKLLVLCWSPTPVKRPNAYECSQLFAQYYSKGRMVHKGISESP